jgi:hypothetical protein
MDKFDPIYSVLFTESRTLMFVHLTLECWKINLGYLNTEVSVPVAAGSEA